MTKQPRTEGGVRPMNAQEKIRRAYRVSVRPADETADDYRLSFVPRGLQQVRGPGGGAKRVPEYKATAQVRGDAILVTWEKPPSDPEATQEDFDQDVRARVGALETWIKQLRSLVDRVHMWAKEFGWAVRDVYKPLEDNDIGDYKAPGLVLQRDMTRVGLEPISCAAGGAEGLVDLYMLPAYDDIAMLFFFDDRWHLHYAGGTSNAVEDKPLTKKAFRDVLDAITRDG